MNGNFIALDRGVIDHPLLKDGERLRAWIWLLVKACWKPIKYDVSGKIITLGRGQLCVSRSQLAQAWGWSESAVERFLTRLKTEQMIERETGQGKTVITICNYGKYQDANSETGQPTEQATGQRSDSDRTTKEQRNKYSLSNDSSYLNRGRVRADVDADQAGEDEPAKPDAVPSTKRGTRIKPDWNPEPLPENLLAMVNCWPDGRLETALDEFRDFWLAATRNATKLDWDRTWHNRIRQIHERMEARNGTTKPTRSRAGGHGDAINDPWLAACVAGSSGGPDGEGPRSDDGRFDFAGPDR